MVEEEHNSDSYLSPERPAHQRSDSDPSPPRRHPTDGNRAGLQTSKVSRAENDEMRQRRERELKDMDPSMLGKEADTVYSDKHGRRIYPKLEKVDKVNIFMSGEEG
ncbi:BUD13 homolog isoform X6 [Dysidea avara]|uniref:BUD13 homolog isoform X6 n=1 Tax=Dysidea avara TaxID=196820 RepID=UPI0033175FE4